MESQILADALRSVREPIEKFIATGIYANPYQDEDMPQELIESAGFISAQQTQRVCRSVAKELKRPFIIMSPVIRTGNWIRKNDRWVRQACEPAFEVAHIQMPKRKYLMPLVTPLLLAGGDTETAASVWELHQHSNWCFQIHNEQLWLEYRAAMDRPEMREARRLPPL